MGCVECCMGGLGSVIVGCEEPQNEAEQLCVVVGAAANGMLVLDESGRIVLANAEAERILGYDAGTLFDVAVDTLRCEELDHAVASLRDCAVKIDPLSFVANSGVSVALRGDGRSIAVEISAKTMRSASGRLALVVIDDLAERREYRDRRPVPPPDAPALGEGEEPAIGRWRFDMRSGELAWSDEVYALYGLPLSGKPSREAAAAAYAPEDRARLTSLVKGAMEDGVAFRDEAQIIRPDGTQRRVVHGGQAQRDASGTIVAISGFVTVVGERRSVGDGQHRFSEYVALTNQAGKVGFWELDLRTNASVWDSNMYSLYGVTDTATVPSYEAWEAMLHPHDRERTVRQIKDDIATGSSSDSEYRVICKNGQIRNVRSLATVVRNSDGAPIRIIGTDWDVTEVRMLADELRTEKEALITSEARYRALSEAMPQLVWVADAQGRLEYVNGRWQQYFGSTNEQTATLQRSACIHADDLPTLVANRAISPPREFECEARMRHHGGAFRWHLLRSVPFFDSSGDGGKWISTATDIEERKAAEKQLAANVAELDHLAHHDSMTNLPNRMLLTTRLEHALTIAKRAQSALVVLYIDLDRFKAINDSFGHAAGDHVLKITGARIAGSLRSGDTASRVGGDEFVVICAALGGTEDAAHLAARLLAAVTQPIDVAGNAVSVEASIGISSYPIDGSDADVLIRKADAAMYSAKQSGRNTFMQYGDEANVSIVTAALLEAELRHAVTAAEFVVHYQPIIDLPSHRIIGAEALVRWQHPRRGLLFPGDFIAIAEERGLISHIGEAVVHAVCIQLAGMQLHPDTDFRVAINVSAHQFGKAGFVAGVVAALARHGVSAQRITIEITESLVMSKSPATVAALHELRSLGMHISIDDFGTGYSSLAYLKDFPIDTLKIDRSFVTDIAEDITDQAIAKTIVTLAHSLGMRVVAEGVETEPQLAELRSLGADSVQGYLFCRPIPAAALEAFIAAFPALGVPVLDPS